MFVLKRKNNSKLLGIENKQISHRILNRSIHIPSPKPSQSQLTKWWNNNNIVVVQLSQYMWNFPRSAIFFQRVMVVIVISSLPLKFFQLRVWLFSFSTAQNILFGIFPCKFLGNIEKYSLHLIALTKDRVSFNQNIHHR